MVKSIAERLVRRSYNVSVLCGESNLDTFKEEWVNGTDFNGVEVDLAIITDRAVLTKERYLKFAILNLIKPKIMIIEAKR